MYFVCVLFLSFTRPSKCVNCISLLDFTVTHMCIAQVLLLVVVASTVIMKFVLMLNYMSHEFCEAIFNQDRIYCAKKRYNISFSCPDVKSICD